MGRFPRLKRPIPVIASEAKQSPSSGDCFVALRASRNDASYGVLRAPGSTSAAIAVEARESIGAGGQRQKSRRCIHPARSAGTTTRPDPPPLHCWPVGLVGLPIGTMVPAFELPKNRLLLNDDR